MALSVPDSRPVLSLFLVFHFFKVSQIQILAMGNGWMTGDWLINYSAGLVRRGLFGEVALLAHGLTGISLLGFVTGLKILLYAGFALGLLALIWRGRVASWEAVLVLSPWFLMADLYDSGGSGRKDIALLAFFAAWAWLQSRPRLESRREPWILGVAFILLTLAHEGLFFFLQFFLVFRLLRDGGATPASLRGFLIPYGLAALALAALFLFFRGDASTADRICLDLIARGIPENLCWGGIGSLAGFAFRIEPSFWWNYLPTAVLTMAPLAAYGWWAYPGRRLRDAALVVVLAVLPTVPLYFLAADWGRWIRLTAMLGFLCLFVNRRREVGPAKAGPAGLLFLAPAFLYLLAWRLPHHALGRPGTAWLLDWGRIREALPGL